MIALGPIAFRYLELALIGLSLVLLVVLFLKRRPPALVWLGAVAVIALAVHLYWEDGRWQMVGIYLLVLFLSFWVARPSGSGTGHRAYRGGGLVLRIVIAVLWVGSTLVPMAFPLPVLAPPSGPHPVGSVSLVVPVEDESRRVSIWYPAKEPASYAAPYWSAATLSENRLPGLPRLAATHLPLVATPATVRAPLVDGDSFPLLLVSRADAVLPGDLDHFAREAASMGWMAVDPGPIDQADAFSLLAALSSPTLDSAIGDRVDSNRVVVLSTSGAPDLELGVTEIRLGGAHVLEATLPGGGIALDYPGLVVPDPALTQRHVLIKPARLLVGGSDVAPAVVQEALIHVLAALLGEGSAAAPVFGGPFETSSMLAGGDDRAAIRPISP